MTEETSGREEMKRAICNFRAKLRKLPVVVSIEEVSDILMAAPCHELKHSAALSIS